MVRPVTGCFISEPESMRYPRPTRRLRIVVSNLKKLPDSSNAYFNRSLSFIDRTSRRELVFPICELDPSPTIGDLTTEVDLGAQNRQLLFGRRHEDFRLRCDRRLETHFRKHLLDSDVWRNALQLELAILRIAVHRPRRVDAPWSGVRRKPMTFARARPVEEPRRRNEIDAIDEFALLLIGHKDGAPSQRCDAIGAAGTAKAPSFAAFVLADDGRVDVAIAIDLQ